MCGQPHLKQPNNQKKAIEFNFHDDPKPQQYLTNENGYQDIFEILCYGIFKICYPTLHHACPWSNFNENQINVHELSDPDL